MVHRLPTRLHCVKSTTDVFHMEVFKKGVRCKESSKSRRMYYLGGTSTLILEVTKLYMTLGARLKTIADALLGRSR